MCGENKLIPAWNQRWKNTKRTQMAYGSAGLGNNPNRAAATRQGGVSKNW